MTKNAASAELNGTKITGFNLTVKIHKTYSHFDLKKKPYLLFYLLS
jgi:hypothetical protein